MGQVSVHKSKKSNDQGQERGIIHFRFHKIFPRLKITQGSILQAPGEF
jgi:hypothetical protein